MDFLLSDLVEKGYVRVPDNFRGLGKLELVVDKYKETRGRIAEMVEETTEFGSRLLIVDINRYL